MASTLLLSRSSKQRRTGIGERKAVLSGAIALLLAFSVSAAQSAEARHRHHGSSSKHHHSLRHHLAGIGRHLLGRRHRGAHQHVAARIHHEIGMLVLTENGETVVDKMSSNEFNPASVVKVITAYGALSKFGPNHRFNTDIYMDGELDHETGILNGDLYLKGCDPDFEKQDAEAVARALKQQGVKEIRGKLIVDPKFSYRSDPNPHNSAASVARIFRSGNVACRLPIDKGAAVGAVPENAEHIGQFESETLRETLKRVLSFSLNRVAEQIGRTIGGVDELENIVSQEAGLAPGSLKLASASGLGQSRVKPRDMMLILKSLRGKLQANGLDYQDIFPVAGIDPGTLDERFTAPEERGSVVAKTGTLPGTDGGTSALAGMCSAQQENLYFVIFCWHGSVPAFRHQQDEIIRQLQARHGGPKPLEYRRVPGDQEVQLN